MRTLFETRFRLVFASVLYAAVAVAIAMGVYQNTLRGGLSALQDTGAVRLSEAASRLRLQIDGYRALANVVAATPELSAALRAADFSETPATLAEFEATYGAWRIDLLSPSGALLASSNWGQPNPRYPSQLLRAALNNRLGFAQALESGERVIRLSRGVLAQGPRPTGLVVVSVSLSALEFEWPVSPEPIVFFNAEELSFSSNRPELLLSRGGDPEEAAFDLTAQGRVGDIALWRFDPPEGAALEVIKAELFIPLLDLTGVISLDTSQARAAAWLRAGLALAAALVLGLIGTIALQQARGRVLQQQYAAQLEARVAARTKELRDAQDALVEASKLAALGRFSAGVSHELNQPLGAILNFAENGQTFLARGRTEPVAQNLTLISDQVRRITRIIGNLRAFARQEVAPTDQVDFAQVVTAALILAQTDITKAGVTLTPALPDAPLPVLAGRVRLEQVVLNLVSNALDAMAEREKKRLTVTLQRIGGEASLCVADTGHGIADPSRVFEPFYTTKDLGASKGLGMGLALSFGIVTRFGGSLTCRNTSDGAEFKLTLPLLEPPS